MIVCTKIESMSSYRDLEVYNVSYQLSILVHELTLKLPKFELYEEGSQIRRSSKSIVSNIVEGYGRKRYKSDFIRFLVYAHSSCDETVLHLNIINDTHKGLDQLLALIADYENLGRKLYSFISYVEKSWNAKLET